MRCAVLVLAQRNTSVTLSENSENHPNIKKGVDTMDSHTVSKAKTQIRAKNIMYTQQLRHLPAKTVDQLATLIETQLKPERYAIVTHDKDVDEKGLPTEAHAHAMMSFQNARSLNNVAKLLGDKPQYLTAWKGSAGNGYAYLIHATKDAQTKHQYNPDEVIANFDYKAEIQSIAADVVKASPHLKAQRLLDALMIGAVTKEEVEEHLTGSQYAKFHRQIEDVYARRLEILAQRFREDMIAQGKSLEVVWIYGYAGTGKTTLAKEYAKKRNEKYFVSGSSRDIFQKYKGEHTIILDEMRPDVMTYADLLRIMDPFGARDVVMAPSRYNDKALSCDLMIVTTPYSPYAFYTAKFGTAFGNMSNTVYTDSFEQLLRRISLIIKMDYDWISPVEYKEQTHTFEEIKSAKRKNPYSSKNYPAPSSNAVNLFNSMF